MECELCVYRQDEGESEKITRIYFVHNYGLRLINKWMYTKVYRHGKAGTVLPLRTPC